MTNHFTINIRLANAQMQHVEEIQEALANVIEVLPERAGFDWPPNGPEVDRPIRDINGNVVGSWRIADQETPNQVAQRVLANHALDGHPDWLRSVEQLTPLLAEAVRIARGEQ